MAYEIPGFVLGTLLAGDDLSAQQYRFVDLADGDAVGLAAAASQPLGTLNNKAAEGAVCEVVTSGVAKVVSEGVISEGDHIEVGAAAGAVTLAAGFSCGIALEDAVANQVISVRLGDYGK